MEIGNNERVKRGATDEHYEMVDYSKEIISKQYVGTVTVSDTGKIELSVPVKGGAKLTFGYTHTESGKNKKYKVRYKITATMKVYDGMSRYLRTVTQVLTPTVTEYEPI